MESVLDCGIEFGLGLAIAVQEGVVVGHGFFEELLEQKDFGRADNSIDALLKRLHGGKGLKGGAKENYGGVAALAHGHVLERLQGAVFGDGIGRKQFFENHYLIAELA